MKIKCLRWFGVIAMLSNASFALAAMQLNASVDRNKIYQNDTINLQITGNIEVDMSIGGLLSFGRSQMEAPDTSAITQDFQILDQRQSYSMKTINGRSQSLSTWSFTLAPKRVGTLRIPAIDYQGAKSNEIVIDVLSGAAPKNEDNPPPLFIEAEIDKSSAYVQEQLVYTIRLYAVSQVRGELSDPSPQDAIVERLGETKKFYRMAYNQRYEVQENSYLIFPQQSGALTIEAQSFNGFVVNPRTRNRVHVRELSEALTVNIKAPPAEFSGDIWLPAISMAMNEKWEQSPDSTSVGDSLTRTIEIQALGLLGSALPPVATADIKGFKVYPDQPNIESFAHENGVQSLRRETTALVAIREGQARLPEIKLPWWDTVNDVERVAVIPARDVAVEALVGDASQTPTPATMKNNELVTDLAQVGSTDISETPVPDGQTSKLNSPARNNNITPWLLVIALLIIAWGSTTWFLLGKLREPRSDEGDNNNTQSVQFKQLIQLVKKNDPEFSRLLVGWLQQQQPSLSIRSLHDIPDSWDDLRESALAFEATHYGKASDRANAFSEQALIDALMRFNKASSNTTTQDSNMLQPLYP